MTHPRLLLLALVVSACGPAEHEQACIDECYTWLSGCRFDCDTVLGCDDDQGGAFCDRECLEEEGGKPRDCEECFFCMRWNEQIAYTDASGTELRADFCPPDDEPEFSELASEDVQPCAAECSQCL